MLFSELGMLYNCSIVAVLRLAATISMYLHASTIHQTAMMHSGCNLHRYGHRGAGGGGENSSDFSLVVGGARKSCRTQRQCFFVFAPQSYSCQRQYNCMLIRRLDMNEIGRIREHIRDHPPTKKPTKKLSRLGARRLSAPESAKMAFGFVGCDGVLRFLALKRLPLKPFPVSMLIWQTIPFTIESDLNRKEVSFTKC